jgi:hypothetical protein
MPESVLYRAHTIPPGRTSGVWSSGRLTGYVAELIGADAARRGQGTRIDVRVAGTTSDESLSAIIKHLRRAAGRDIVIRVRRDVHLGPSVRPPVEASGDAALEEAR